MVWLAVLPPLIALVYCGWQLRNFRRWRNLLAEGVAPAVPPGDWPRVAVLVPFRNEADNLPNLLADLLAQEYPPDRYEIICIDDHSTDGGPAIVSASGGRRRAGAVPSGAAAPRIELLSLADHPEAITTVAHKKLALGLAVDRTNADIITTTDADCRWPPTALRTLAGRVTAGADVVLGPVLIAPVRNFCAAFQALDLASYQLYTAACAGAGDPTLANGANFSFRRHLFLEVGGYAGVDHLPSGDDVLLLHKFSASGAQPNIAYAVEPAAVVTTRPVIGWRALWRQRLRWAGKAGAYVSPTLKLAQALTFLTCLGVVVGCLLGPADWRFAAGALSAWVLKAFIDAVLLTAVCRHYGRGGLLRWYAPVQLLYPFYMVAIGTAALLGVKTRWKGRRPGAG